MTAVQFQRTLLSAAGHMVIIAALYAASHLSAAPMVSSSKSITQEQLHVSIIGSELPELQSITFVCSFDQQQIVLMDAIISSPVPSTAFSASIDTSENQLTVSVMATSTIQVGNNESLAVLRIPVIVGNQTATAFYLTSANYTDAAGQNHSVAIGTTALSYFRPSLFNHVTLKQKKDISAYFLINGRCCGRNIHQNTSGFVLHRSNRQKTTKRIFIK